MLDLTCACSSPAGGWETSSGGQVLGALARSEGGALTGMSSGPSAVWVHGTLDPWPSGTTLRRKVSISTLTSGSQFSLIVSEADVCCRKTFNMPHSSPASIGAICFWMSDVTRWHPRPMLGNRKLFWAHFIFASTLTAHHVPLLAPLSPLFWCRFFRFFRVGGVEWRIRRVTRVPKTEGRRERERARRW